MNKSKLKKGLSYYTDKRGKIRWRLVGENNRIVCASTQGFANRAKASENATLTREGLAHV